MTRVTYLFNPLYRKYVTPVTRKSDFSTKIDFWNSVKKKYRWNWVFGFLTQCGNMISPLHPEESLDSIIEKLNLNCWCDGKCQNQLNHRFSAIMFASWLFESCTWLLPTIFTYEYPFMVRIIACNNVCNSCEHPRTIFANSWTTHEFFEAK